MCDADGAIRSVSRRCGKPTCHCAKPNDPGHDPQVRLSRTVHGKTLAESFASPSAFHKAQAEVQEYQRWQRLCAEFVNISERICRLRPVDEEALGAQKGGTEERIQKGVTESGCKTAIASWLKPPGMLRTNRGANAIVALRCGHLNGQFEDYREARRAV